MLLLYLHIPFCDSKCFYCAFNSFTDQNNLKEKYFKAMLLQLKNSVDFYNINSFETVFFGGGTPSAVTPNLYRDLFSFLEPFVDNKTEITFEANPNSTTQEMLKELKNFGVNRMSFGVQSFDDAKLTYLGRAHNRKKAIQAIEDAHKIGFCSINCDILYNTKCDTKSLILQDLNLASKLGVNHISAYSLMIEEQTKLHACNTVQIDDVGFSRFCIEAIQNNGFMQYEIANFATSKEHFSNHNLGYWQQKEYLGIGAGAVGCIANNRITQEKSIQGYIDKHPPSIEKLHKDAIFLEELFLGFRSCVGVGFDTLTPKQKANAMILIQNKKITKKENQLYNNDYLVADEVALFICRS